MNFNENFRGLDSLDAIAAGYMGYRLKDKNLVLSKLYLSKSPISHIKLDVIINNKQVSSTWKFQNTMTASPSNPTYKQIVETRNFTWTCLVVSESPVSCFFPHICDMVCLNGYM